VDELDGGDLPPDPAVGWASGPLGAVQAADREIGRQTALRARALVEFAATRPASVDRPPGQAGCMSAERRATRPEVLAGVSEWAAQELALALSIPTPTADGQLARALTLAHRLPRTLDALEQGALHPGHLWPLLEKVAPITERRLRERLEADLLAWVGTRDVTTPAQLGAKVRRELLARNVRSAARELEAALRRRGVDVRPDRVDGMAVLTASLTVPEAEALLDALRCYADVVEDDPDDPAAGPPRTRQQKMADCLLDLVLRPGDTTLPAVQTQLTVTAGVSTLVGGDGPAEVAGHPVPAEMVRALARALGLLPDAPPAAAGSHGPVPDQAVLSDRDSALAEAEERWWAAVEARALRGEWGGEDDPPLEELQSWWGDEGRSASDPPWPDRGRSSPGSEPAAGPASPDPGTSLGTEPSWWAAADRRVDEAGARYLEFDRAMARACRAVEAAEIADLADRDEWEHSPVASISSAPDALAALALATTAQRAALAGLLDRTGGGGLVDRPRIAVTDALTGALLVLTDARELRASAAAGRGLGPPGASPGYRPGAALDRFTRARDRRCRFPGCRRRVPRGGELDHVEPWPAGPTAAANLTGFCTAHHRGKHQAPGWQFDLASDGTLTVTTPTGLTATTAPPPF
jgi:hypothetical protein